MKAVLIFSLLLTVSAAAQTRTITNFDLEKYKTEREAADKQLREIYKQRGLGTPEDVARERAERLKRYEAEYEASRQQRLASENDILTEAYNLRLQIADVDAQIAYLQNSGTSYRGGAVVGFGYTSYGTYGPRRIYDARRQSPELRRIAQLPPNMRTVQETATMYPSSQSIFQQATQGVRVAPSAPLGGYRGGYSPYYAAPVVVAQTNSGQLNYLLQQRAGLYARWRILEETARRAGVRLE